MMAGVAVGAMGAGLFVAVAPAGAGVPQDCENYEPCVPMSEDVDCAGGDGNGPVYIDYPVEVIGEDVYGLDHDGDGVGCESETTPTTDPAPTETTAPPVVEPAPAAPVAAPVVAQPDFTG
jgi:hypothetical protein